MADDDDGWLGSPSKRDPAWKLADDPPRYILIPESAPDPVERERLLRMWRYLPRFPFLLEQVGTSNESAVAFAAIDWTAAKLPLGPAAATLGVKFTRVFEFVAVCAPSDELGWFACPFVKIDVEGVPRVGFSPPTASAEHASRIAPEAIDNWPRLDERGMVYAVGRLLMDVTVVTREQLADPLAVIIRRCLLTNPARRFATLKELRTALVEVRGTSRWHARVADKRWPWIEHGLGLAALGHWNRALDQLAAFDPAGHEKLVAAGIQAARARGAQPSLTNPVSASEPVLTRTWADVAVAGARLEANHDPHGALALYQSIREEAVHRVPHFLAVARTSLAAGDYGHAIDYARKLTPSRESLAIEAKGWIAKREPAKALDVIERWEALAPGEAAPVYQRGKALLLLSRLPEARAAFDTALARDGKMIEAMLLRREVDRHMGKHREAVGAQQQASASPELLALIGAEPAEAIAALSADRFAGDPYAQLMLAELLVGEQRYADALASYDRAIAELPQARKGKAMALLELGRAQEALDALGDAKDMAATELRAWIQSKIVKS